MTDKAVQRKALQNSLLACSADLQKHVQCRGILARTKLPVALLALRMLARVAGLGCSTADVMQERTPTCSISQVELGLVGLRTVLLVVFYLVLFVLLPPVTPVFLFKS
jgi:hypothetical protein